MANDRFLGTNKTGMPTVPNPLMQQLQAAEQAYTSSRPGAGRNQALAALQAIQQQVASAGINPANPPGNSPSAVNNAGVTAGMGQMFPDKTVLNAATGAQGIYNSIITPQYQVDQMHNAQLPSYGADPNIMNQGEMLARLRAESFGGNQNSAEMNQSMGLLQNQAMQGDYISPEMRQAFDASKSLVNGDVNSPIANAQRQQLNQGMDRSLQTAMRANRGANLARGVGGGGQAMGSRGIANDYAQAYGNAQTQLQLGNLSNYNNMAGAIDQNQFQRGFDSKNLYGQAISARDQFNEARTGERLNRYNTAMNTAQSRTDTLGEVDRTRMDNYRSGEIGGIYGGAGYGETYQGRLMAEKYNNAAIAAMKKGLFMGTPLAAPSTSGTGTPTTGTGTTSGTPSNGQDFHWKGFSWGGAG